MSNARCSSSLQIWARLSLPGNRPRTVLHGQIAKFAAFKLSSPSACGGLLDSNNAPMQDLLNTRMRELAAAQRRTDKKFERWLDPLKGSKRRRKGK